MAEDQNLMLVDLKQSDKEYQTILQDFSKSLQRSPSIVKVKCFWIRIFGYMQHLIIIDIKDTKDTSSCAYRLTLRPTTYIIMKPLSICHKHTTAYKWHHEEEETNDNVYIINLLTVIIFQHIFCASLRKSKRN